MPSSASPTEHLIAVAVPVPGLGLLTYRVTGPDPPPAGARVRVPVGSRILTGCVVDAAAVPPDGAELRDITAVLDREPFLPATVVSLSLWVAEYYAAGPGDALAMAMPPASRGDRATSFRSATVLELRSESPTALPRGARQRQLLALLQQAPAGVLRMDAIRAAGLDLATARRLADLGFAHLRSEITERDPFSGDARGSAGSVGLPGSPMSPGSPWSLTADVPGAASARGAAVLTREQASALERLTEAADAQAFQTVLLHGVTGSGKTELYLRLARHVMDSGRRVLILVPEIALTPAMAGSLRSAFGDRVAIQHSALSAGERHDQWHRIRRGDVGVVVGTRSAVFAPIESLGLIVVDEEHESSYKQDESPRYHGRDVAVMRGRMEGALVVLGSATPSLESALNAESGRYQLIRLTERVLGRPLAVVRVVDMRREFAARGAHVTMSEALVEGIAARLARGEQCLVLLNRRGFATVVFCRQCGAPMECPHCSVTLTYHRGAHRMRCHYCNYATAVPRRCPACGGEYLHQSGFGTERIESDLRERFPSARIVRVDRDTVRRRGAIAGVLAAVGRGEIDVIVGTQMIAKGHDFPSVTLAGVISADVGLGFPDFRAAERTFQLLTQVVGRAGRGELAGEAIIQTLYPDHYSVRAAAAQDYAAFYAREIEFRRSLEYPPATGLISVTVRSRSLEQAMADAGAVVALLREQRAPARIIGPSPAPLAKIADEYRAQFFLKGPSRRALRIALLAALAPRPDLKRRTIIDIE